MELVRDYFLELGFSPAVATAGAVFAAIVAAGLVAEALNVAARIVAMRVAPLKDAWIEAFERRHVFRSSAWVIMVVLIDGLIAPVLLDWPETHDAFETVFRAAFVLALAVAVSGMINAGIDILRDASTEGPKLPFKVLGQALQLVLWSCTAVIFLSVVTHRDVTTLLAGMTAVGALLVYVFRDPILGWTASMQLMANDLAWTGDWVTVPSHGADGRVIEIALTTVKVRNWDETISTIPTYALVSEGFRNWRGMFESGGRRIRRALTIDATSIRCCDRELFLRLRRNRLLSRLIDREHGAGSESARPEDGLDGVCLTNLGCFRRWLDAWLKEHPKIHQGMRIAVRELEPAGRGIPVEIYAFSNDTSWVSYEQLQADIYDQVLAVLPAFDLRLFQEPSGMDVQQKREHATEVAA